MECSFTLRGSFCVPEGWAPHSRVRLLLPIGDVTTWDFCHPEALVHIDGQPVAACDKFHLHVPVPHHCRDGKSHTLALHGYTGRWGYFEEGPPDKLLMRQCEVVLVDEPTQDFLALCRVGLGTAQALDEEDPTGQASLTPWCRPSCC